MNEHVDTTEFQGSETQERSNVRRTPQAPGRTPVEPATARKRRGLKRVLLGLGGLALLSLGADYGWWYWRAGRFLESTDDAYVQADSTIIAPKVSGYLQSVLVTDNQRVKAGQLLAVIDDRDYAVALKQASANVDAARASIENIEATIQQQQAVIEQARSTVLLDRANLTFTQQDNARYSTLAKTGAGSVQNAQQAISKLGIADATLKRDTAAATAADGQVKILRAQLVKAEADLAFAQGQEEQAKLNLSYTKVQAPIDGIVGNRTLRVGQYVQAGTALLSVVPLSAIYIVANLKETQLTHIRPGQPVGIEVDAFPNESLKGTVDSIAPGSGEEFALLPPDNATGNFTKVVQRIPVKIDVSLETRLKGELRPGMSVVPAIDTKGE